MTTDDVEQDFEAVMSSKESLRQIFAPNDDWPADEMTLQDNYNDLQRHESDFDQRVGFTYTVVTVNEQSCLGCVYIYPSPTKQHDARVYYWVRDSAKPQELDKKLGDFLHHWVADAWPFHNPVFPGREISWAEWELLT
ncbi:GNAT family N-acetyltransferase [Chloroflexi bacterium TSY]|nr:GNAT family N-acetyltransferase [Chloroflexi bacterium TSY]